MGKIDRSSENIWGGFFGKWRAGEATCYIKEDGAPDSCLAGLFCLARHEYDVWLADWLYCWRMDVERIIEDVRQLEEMFEAPDIRPLTASDVSAANRKHDEVHANSPWFKLWQDFGICCRPEAPVIRLPE